MKKIFFCFALLSSCCLLHAQRLLLTGFAGISNYQGDLQDKKYTFGQAHIAGGIGLAYELSDQLYIRGGFALGKISADDKKSSINSTRNLNFSSPLSELQVGLEYDLINLKEQNITPCLFAGLAMYHFNPSTKDAGGNLVYLQPLGTEGQGFYNGRTKYKLNGFSIPFGGGLKMAVNDVVRIGIEIGFRKTFTDYLDDVSTTYADKSQLLANNGPQAVKLAFRSNELNPAFNYPAAGNIRGNPTSKDWYYFTGLTIGYRLNAGDGSSFKGGKSKTACPRNVY